MSFTITFFVTFAGEELTVIGFKRRGIRKELREPLI